MTALLLFSFKTVKALPKQQQQNTYNAPPSPQKNNNNRHRHPPCTPPPPPNKKMKSTTTSGVEDTGIENHYLRFTDVLDYSCQRSFLHTHKKTKKPQSGPQTTA